VLIVLLAANGRVHQDKHLVDAIREVIRQLPIGHIAPQGQPAERRPFAIHQRGDPDVEVAPALLQPDAALHLHFLARVQRQSQVGEIAQQ
jgi:hypothetical protein